MRIVRDVGQGDPCAGRGADPPHVGEGGGRGLPTDCAGGSCSDVDLNDFAVFLTFMNLSELIVP